MLDYLCIGEVLDLKKYERRAKISDFKDQEIFIILAKSIKGQDKEGFYLVIEDIDHKRYDILTYSRIITSEIKDLLMMVSQTNGVFEKPIKCKLQVDIVKTKNETYSERYKLI